MVVSASLGSIVKNSVLAKFSRGPCCGWDGFTVHTGHVAQDQFWCAMLRKRLLYRAVCYTLNVGCSARTKGITRGIFRMNTDRDTKWFWYTYHTSKFIFRIAWITSATDVDTHQFVWCAVKCLNSAMQCRQDDVFSRGFSMRSCIMFTASVV